MIMHRMLSDVAMQSPFPGMNPYLENPELWSEVHSRLIVAIADDLTAHLSEKYRVAIKKRTYFSGGRAAFTHFGNCQIRLSNSD